MRSSVTAGMPFENVRVTRTSSLTAAPACVAKRARHPGDADKSLASVEVKDDGDVIRALFAAFSARDLDTALDLVTEDVEYWPKIIMVLAGREEPYRGHEGVRAYFEDLAALFEHVEVEVESVRAVAGGAAAFGTSRGTPVGGQPYDVPLMLMVRLREGRVAYARSAASVEELEAG